MAFMSDAPKSLSWGSRYDLDPANDPEEESDEPVDEELAETIMEEIEEELSDMGMRISFRDLEYQVPNRQNSGEKLKIIKGISGFYLPREMAAVMGPSGSGKSTHLDILAGRKTVGEITGDITFAGQKATKAFLKRFTGYVEQFDTLLPELTVEEMLLYTAELKCSLKEPLSSKRARVEELIKTLALTPCRNTYIGDAMAKGISGGQAKRTNIGIALITKPRILFLDEPTSGLDSFTAHEVMSVVKKLVASGITIVATIHCPPPHTFRLFDRVLMLQKGSITYFGVNGPAVTNYFYTHFENVRVKLEEENLAEWLVDITSEEERLGSDRYFVGYLKSEMYRENIETLDRFRLEESQTPISPALKKVLKVKKTTTTPIWKGLQVMLKYRTKNNYISPYYLFGRIFDKAMFTLFTFLYYWHIGKNQSTENIVNITGLLFTWVILPAWGAGPYLPAIVLERPIFIRETNDGLYTAFTYLLYKMIEELTMALLMSVGFSLLVFYLCEVQGSFVVFWITWFVSLADGIAFAYAAASIAPTMDIANCLLLTLPTLLLFGCGFMIIWDSIPKYVRWLSYLNWLHFAWKAVMINQYKGKNVMSVSNVEVLTYYHVDDDGPWASIGYESLTFVVLIFLTWCCLMFFSHQKR